jgi:uncharacterized protein YdeI (YjbR/CyaY-like superfamily)
MSPQPTYFANVEELRHWLAAHAETASELLVGFMKRHTDATSMTWPQAVDEALCFGWIDGVRRRVDNDRYQIRFTPRKPGSTWSAVNIVRFAELQKQGRVMPPGIAAFEQRTEKKSRTYSYEQAESPELNSAETKELKRNKRAWAFFEALPPSYRRKMVWWIISAKQETTRQKRFASFARACAECRKL